MIEHRPLTDTEFAEILKDAPPSETEGLIAYAARQNETPAEFIKRHAFVIDGVVATGRPIYFSAILKSDRGFFFWTIVNSNVREQVSLYKIAHRELQRLRTKHVPLFACMKCAWEKNLKWTKRLGFSEVERNDQYVLLQLV